MGRDYIPIDNHRNYGNYSLPQEAPSKGACAFHSLNGLAIKERLLIQRKALAKSLESKFFLRQDPVSLLYESVMKRISALSSSLLQADNVSSKDLAELKDCQEQLGQLKDVLKESSSTGTLAKKIKGEITAAENVLSQLRNLAKAVQVYRLQGSNFLELDQVFCAQQANDPLLAVPALKQLLKSLSQWDKELDILADTQSEVGRFKLYELHNSQLECLEVEIGVWMKVMQRAFNDNLKPLRQLVKHKDPSEQERAGRQLAALRDHLIAMQKETKSFAKLPNLPAELCARLASLKGILSSVKTDIEALGPTKADGLKYGTDAWFLSKVSRPEMPKGLLSRLFSYIPESLRPSTEKVKALFIGALLFGSGAFVSRSLSGAQEGSTALRVGPDPSNVNINGPVPIIVPDVQPDITIIPPEPAPPVPDDISVIVIPPQPVRPIIADIIPPQVNTSVIKDVVTPIIDGLSIIPDFVTPNADEVNVAKTVWDAFAKGNAVLKTLREKLRYSDNEEDSKEISSLINQLESILADTPPSDVTPEAATLWVQEITETLSKIDLFSPKAKPQPPVSDVTPIHEGVEAQIAQVEKENTQLIHDTLQIKATVPTDSEYANLIGLYRPDLAYGKKETEIKINGIPLNGLIPISPFILVLDTQKAYLQALKSHAGFSSACREEVCRTVFGEFGLTEFSKDGTALENVIDKMDFAIELDKKSGLEKSRSVQARFEALQPGESFFIPSGWLGHSIVMEVEKDSNGKMLLRLWNTGQGIDLHSKRETPMECVTSLLRKWLISIRPGHLGVPSRTF